MSDDDEEIPYLECLKMVRIRKIKATKREAELCMNPVTKCLSPKKFEKFLNVQSRIRPEKLFEYYQSATEGPESLYPIENLLSLCRLYENESTEDLRKFLESHATGTQNKFVNMKNLINLVSGDYI